MLLRRAAPLLLALAAACHPGVRGRCASDTDCRAGSSCSPDGLCVNLLRPIVQVVLPAGTVLAPSAADVLVRVTASPQLSLGPLSVAVTAGRSLATGSIDAPVVGNNHVTLTHFEPGAVGQVAVTATLDFTPPGGAADEVSSDAAVAAIDTQPPAVSVFVPATADMVNGWVPRTTGTLEVRAQVDDGAGSGAASATLTLDRCPASAPCSYAGALLSRPSAGAATFSFVVPRAVQAPGSEARVTGAVVGLDRLQNAGRKAVSLQIDDAPPALGAVTLVSTGTSGEDGRSWFKGGPGALPVEVSVAASDSGAGLLDVVLHLNQADVASGTPDPDPMANPDGTVHFRLPASAVTGREGALRFTVVARDALHNTAALPETKPGNQVWIDDVFPTVTNLNVNYASAMPPTSEVCAIGTTCGRGSPPDHFLRDDVATITFDAYDCGVGLSAATGATINGLDATAAGTGASSCGNGNPVHHYTLQLDLAAQKPGAPDINGSETLALTASAADLLAHRFDNANGSAQISIVRWRSLLASTVGPAGSPALLPGPPASSLPRQIVVSNTATAGNNLFILDPKGGVTPLSVARITSDVAVDKASVLYAVGIDPSTSATKVSIYDTVNPPVPFMACDIPDAMIGAPPVLAGTPDAPLAVLAATTFTGVHNVFVFTKGKGCTPVDQDLLANVTQNTFSGVSANVNKLFFSDNAAFFSVVFSGTFDQPNAVSYDGPGGNPTAIGAPAISFAPGTAVENPIFAATDRKVRDTHLVTSPCSTVSPCWRNLWPSGAAAGNLNGTPVFDGSSVYVTDSKGIVYAFSLGQGLPQGQVAPVTTAASGIAVSSPVLVGSSQALVVQHDGLVRLLSPTLSAGVTLLQLRTLAGAPVVYPSTSPSIPPTPVVDVRGTGGIAYIPDGAGSVWAVQLDQAPVAASATAWPRPGRDTCNSRNAAASYCP